MAIFDYLSLPAVSIAWVLYMFIASVWYSPLMFNSACEALAHGGKPQKLSKPGMIASALGTAIAMPFFCFMLSVAGCQSALEGALWGAAFGLFFDTGLNCSHSFFEERPFGLFLIHSGCHAVSLTVIGAILGLSLFILLKKNCLSSTTFGKMPALLLVEVRNSFVDFVLQKAGK